MLAMPKKSAAPRISVRIDKELKDRISAVEAATGIDESTIVRRCVEAFCDYVELNGQATFPLLVTPAPARPVRYPEHQPQLLGQAADAANYKVSRKSKPPA